MLRNITPSLVQWFGCRAEDWPSAGSAVSVGDQIGGSLAASSPRVHRCRREGVQRSDEVFAAGEICGRLSGGLACQCRDRVLEPALLLAVNQLRQCGRDLVEGGSTGLGVFSSGSGSLRPIASLDLLDRLAEPQGSEAAGECNANAVLVMITMESRAAQFTTRAIYPDGSFSGFQDCWMPCVPAETPWCGLVLSARASVFRIPILRRPWRPVAVTCPE